jgi:hypothetical protein
VTFYNAKQKSISISYFQLNGSPHLSKVWPARKLEMWICFRLATAKLKAAFPLKIAGTLL